MGALRPAQDYNDGMYPGGEGKTNIGRRLARIDATSDNLCQLDRKVKVKDKINIALRNI